MLTECWLGIGWLLKKPAWIGRTKRRWFVAGAPAGVGKLHRLAVRYYESPHAAEADSTNPVGTIVVSSDSVVSVEGKEIRVVNRSRTWSLTATTTHEAKQWGRKMAISADFDSQQVGANPTFSAPGAFPAPAPRGHARPSLPGRAGQARALAAVAAQPVAAQPVAAQPVAAPENQPPPQPVLEDQPLPQLPPPLSTAEFVDPMRM